MFFLITGASGMGKSTIRHRLEREFGDVLDAAELATLGVTPEWSVAWRQRMVERVVGLALEAQGRGRHFLLCGDPVPPGELWAAPSADRLDGIAVCLLDAAPEVQRARLERRGDPAELLPAHLAFADWMRAHARDPRHLPEVIVDGGWEAMRWERWRDRADPPWEVHVIDTSERAPAEVARAAATWLGGRLPRLGG